MRNTITEAELESVRLDVEDKPLTELKLDKETIDKVMAEMNSPIDKQKELATKLSIFINSHIDTELHTKGYLSEFTRRWVKEYNDLLDKLQKNIYGEKSVNLHLHKVTHAHIASEMRKYADESLDKQ